jgi:hypothetical protein
MIFDPNDGDGTHTMVYAYQTIRRPIPEYSTPHIRSREELKSLRKIPVSAGNQTSFFEAVNYLKQKEQIWTAPCGFLRSPRETYGI